MSTSKTKEHRSIYKKHFSVASMAFLVSCSKKKALVFAATLQTAALLAASSVHILCRGQCPPGVRIDTPAAVPDDEQGASTSGAAAGRPEQAKTKSAKVYGPEWENE